MSASYEKKKLLESVTRHLRWDARGSRSFAIPARIKHRIERSYSRDTAIHSCQDIRDYMTQMAMQGLEEAVYGGDINSVAVKFGWAAFSNISIDYSVIDRDALRKFDAFAGTKYIRTVQNAVNFCVVLGYMNRFDRVTCPRPKEKPSIYS